MTLQKRAETEEVQLTGIRCTKFIYIFIFRVFSAFISSLIIKNNIILPSLRLLRGTRVLFVATTTYTIGRYSYLFRQWLACVRVPNSWSVW